MTLEDQLHEAAAKGLASLTLYAEWSADRKTTYWTCRATPSARHGYVGVEHTLDPVEAMGACLKALPGAKERKDGRQHVSHRGSDPADEKVTAAVTEDEDAPAKVGSFDEWMKP